MPQAVAVWKSTALHPKSFYNAYACIPDIGDKCCSNKAKKIRSGLERETTEATMCCQTSLIMTLATLRYVSHQNNVTQCGLTLTHTW